MHDRSVKRVGRMCAVIGSLLFVVAACGRKSSPPPPAPMKPVDLGPTGLLGLPDHGIQLATDPFDLDPGQETTRCWNVNLKNASPLEVERFQTAERHGLHHFNVFAATLTRDDGFGACPDTMEFFVGARPIVDGSGSSVDYPFPDGLALEIAPNTLVMMQLHFINSTQEKATMQFVLNLQTAPDGATREPVDIYGFTTFDITLPPHQVTTVTKDCTMQDHIRMLTMSSHFHARGIQSTAEIVHPGMDPIPVYQTSSWSEPAVVNFDQQGMFVGVGDIVRFHCTYDNEGDTTVYYGVSAKDEMCFLFGYYYPKVGLIPCF
jgi:hypothetical protein